MICTIANKMRGATNFTRNFLPLQDDFAHYLFTARDLTYWCLSFLRYDLTGAHSDPNAGNFVLEVFAYEARRLFRDRLAGAADRDKFDQLLGSVLRTDFSYSEPREKDGSWCAVAHLIITRNANCAHSIPCPRKVRHVGRLAHRRAQVGPRGGHLDSAATGEATREAQCRRADGRRGERPARIRTREPRARRGALPRGPRARRAFRPRARDARWPRRLAAARGL